MQLILELIGSVLSHHEELLATKERQSSSHFLGEPAYNILLYTIVPYHF